MRSLSLSSQAFWAALPAVWIALATRSIVWLTPHCTLLSLGVHCGVSQVVSSSVSVEVGQ